MMDEDEEFPEDEEAQEPAPRWRVRFSAACGMAVPIDDDLDRREARAAAAKVLRRRRRTGHPIDVLEKGERWEAGEPEGCAMVPDTAGILVLEEYVPKRPRW